ncbi:MAG: aldehyde dehydrogenase family protein [Homoserinimonas sp.]
MEKHANYIAGEWVGGDFRPNASPSDFRDVVGLYSRAADAEITGAIEAASEAQRAWGSRPAGERAALLERIGATIIERSAELGAILAREEGKTMRESIGEVNRAGATFRYFAHQVMQPMGEVYPSARAGITIDVQRRPVGVIGVITPWNYPIAIPAWKIAPALAYGNTVVFKPAELVPASAWMLASIIDECGVPAGVFNLVMGSGRMVGAHLVESRLVSAITFTGSGEVGRNIALQSIEHGNKRFQLEMGGKNPLLVLDDADVDLAVRLAIDGSYFSTGQRCTASSRLIVQAGIHDAFVDGMTAAMSQLVVGDALDPGTTIGPVVSESQLQQDLDYIKLGQDEGATLVAGGERVSRATEGNFLQPALFVGGSNDMRINREEVFGPVACVLKVDDYEHGLTLANDTSYGLSAGIVTTSLGKAHDFRSRAQAGILAINQSTAGTELQVPFGGTKGSSYGPREQGPDARDFFTVVSTAYTASGY